MIDFRHDAQRATAISPALRIQRAKVRVRNTLYIGKLMPEYVNDV